jgi:hypothetical protein
MQLRTSGYHNYNLFNDVPQITMNYKSTSQTKAGKVQSWKENNNTLHDNLSIIVVATIIA